MTFDCPKCKKKYRINESLIPVGGAHVQCPACTNVFSIYRAPLDIPLEPVEEVQPPAPSEREFKVDTEPLKPIHEEPAPSESATSVQTKPPDIETTIPPVEERTKLWEKLQQSYAAEKKTSTTPTEEVAPTASIEPSISTSEEPSFSSPELETTPEEPTAEIAPEVTPTVETPSTDMPSESPPVDTAAFEPPPIQETQESDTISPTAVEETVTEADKTIKEAKRLARSLVKDILLYHGDKVEIGLRQGNLAQLIGDEIRKSWKFYKDSFPLDKTNNVNYFKEALNEIIGKGKPIFK